MKNLEIFFRKLLLNSLLLLKKPEKSLKIESLNPELKILFIRLNRIGDALVSTPLLYHCKKNLNCKVFVLASSSNYFVFNNTNLVDEIIVFNKKVKRLSSIIKMINSLNFDVIVDLHDDVSTTVSYIMAFAKCTYKIGFDKSTKKLYNIVVPKLDPQKFHIVDRIMEFCKPFEIRFDPNKVNIYYRPKEKSIKVAEAFISKNFTNENFLVGINISAGSDARFWGVNNYKKLIDLLQSYEINIVTMCLERDLKNAWEISRRIVPIFYRPVFDEFSAMTGKLNLLFTPDTSIVHIASAFKVPLFGIYVQYNTNDLIWSPYKSSFDAVVTKEPTLENLSFESVKEKFIPFFEKHFYEYKSRQT